MLDDVEDKDTEEEEEDDEDGLASSIFKLLRRVCTASCKKKTFVGFNLLEKIKKSILKKSLL